MKTPTKKQSVSEGPSSPPSAQKSRSALWRRYQVLVITTSPQEAEGISQCCSPDFGVALVNVAKRTEHSLSRATQLEHSKALLELVGTPQALTQFSGVLVDSPFDTGVDCARELLDIPVSGLFWPAISQGLLVAGCASLAIVIVVPGPPPTPVPSALPLITELALRYNVGSRIALVRTHFRTSSGGQDDQLLADACADCARVGGVGCVLVFGAGVSSTQHVVSTFANVKLCVPVIDATIAGVNAIEGLVRQKIVTNRQIYPKCAPSGE